MTTGDRGSGEINNPGLPGTEGFPGGGTCNTKTWKVSDTLQVIRQVRHDDVLNYRVQDKVQDGRMWVV